MNRVDDDSAALDDAPLTHDELKQLRKLLRDDDRATWARRQLMVFAPWLVALITGVWAFFDWASRHIKWGSP